MSAVLQDTEASVNQLPLIQAPAYPLVRWSLWGRLTKQAEVRTATDGTGMLVVQVMQPKSALPFIAIRYERADRRPALDHLVEQMRPGVAVLISGLGFELTSHNGWDPLESTCRHASLSIL